LNWLSGFITDQYFPNKNNINLTYNDRCLIVHENSKIGVRMLFVTSCVFDKLPDLGLVFENVVHLAIENCGLTDINSFSFGLNNIISLSLNNNKLTSINEHQFAAYINLREVSVANNKISQISEGFLQKFSTSQLIYANFKNNTSYDVEFDADSGETKQEFAARLGKCNVIQIPKPNRENFLIEANKFLWESGTLSDFTIKVNEKEFKVHKAVLGANSIVFRKMFAHDMKENIKNEMEITDFTSSVIEEFLLFVYMAQVPETDENLMDLFAISARYEVDKLRNYCESKIKLNLNEDNAIDIMSLANLYNCEELKLQAFSYVKILIKRTFGKEVTDDSINKPELIVAIGAFGEARKNLEKLVIASTSVKR